MSDLYQEAEIETRVPRVEHSRTSYYLTQIEIKLWRIAQVIQNRTDQAREAIIAVRGRVDTLETAGQALTTRVTDAELDTGILEGRVDNITAWRQNTVNPALVQAGNRLDAAEDKTDAVIAALTSAADFEAAKTALGDL